MGLYITTFSLREGLGVGLLSSYLPLPIYQPLICSQCLESHRTARTELLSTYAYLGTKSELASVGETCGSIPVDTSCIYLLLEELGVMF